MRQKRRTYLQIPQGTEGFSRAEAYVHRRIIATLDALYESWGYLPAHTPVFDFFDTYRGLLGDDAVESVYRLIDRDGDLLMLRSDITLFLAKQMGLTLHADDLPVRVYYSDVILRHQNREDISRNEFFQSGVELIGKSGLDADLEVLVLLKRTLGALGLPARVHVGSRALFTACFSDLDDTARRRLASALGARDIPTASSLLGAWSGARIDWTMRLFTFIGGAESLEQLAARAAAPPEVDRELRYLIELKRALDREGIGDAFRIDLSEIGTQPYYTGIVFQTYLHGQDSAIVSGGRYDALFQYFGFPAPSAGFSILLRKVEPVVSESGAYPVPETVRADGADFHARLAAADLLRKDGKAVRL